MPSPSDIEDPAFRARATRLLLALHVFAFFLAWGLRASGFSWVNAAYGLVPSRFSADPTGELPKLLTGLFIHDGFGHLLWNVAFLVLFGRPIEKSLGYGRFLAFFLVTGVLSSLSQFVVDPWSPIPLVGSSGAIAGILGGFLVLFPRRPVTIFRWPAYGVIGFWFVSNLIGGFAQIRGSYTDTAFFAHLGGFLAGLLLIRFFHRDEDAAGPASPYGSRMRVVRPPIFPKNAEGPFWR